MFYNQFCQYKNTLFSGYINVSLICPFPSGSIKTTALRVD